MTNFLIRKFIPDYQNTSDKNVREKYCVLAGVMGICNNFILFVIKLVIGTLSNSIAIISDAFNNLSDMGSSLVSIIGAKLSNRKPDKEHPFGHGRMEYLSSLLVALIIFFVGISLFQTSFQKILHPEELRLNPVLIGVLALSACIKVWMFFYNRYMGNKINSGILKATALDSLNDVYATGAVVLSTILSAFTTLPIDAVLGVVVSVLILFAGYQVAKDTVDLLLGKAPDKELVDGIETILMSNKRIMGTHDLIVHDYGPGRIIASVHAEVRDDENIVEIHEIVDELENRIQDELGIIMIVHTDPISVDCERTNEYKKKIASIIEDIDATLSMHDFRITDGIQHVNLIFDMIVPYEYDEKAAKALVEHIRNEMRVREENVNVVIKIDRAY
jgi:cation diffusion facilitator family transporter